MQVCLPERAILSLDLNRQECVVHCVEGRVWVTVPGDTRDHCFEAGDRCALSGTGKAVIEAVSDAAISLRSPARLAVHMDEAATMTGQARRLSRPLNTTGDLALRKMPPSLLPALG